MAVDQARLERYQKHLAKMKKGNKDGDGLFFQPRVVEDANDFGNQIRLLPIVGWPDPFVEIKRHRIHISGEEYPRSFNCPRCVDLPCPACDILDVIGPRPRSAEDKRLRKNLYASSRFVSKIVDLENLKAGARIYEHPKTVNQAIVALLMHPGYNDVSDPYKGHVITVKRTGEGKDDTEYSTTAWPQSGPINENPEAGPTTDDLVKQAEEMDLAAAVFYETAETIDKALDKGVYDKEEAEALREARDERGEGPRRLGILPEGFTQESLEEWQEKAFGAVDGSEPAPKAPAAPVASPGAPPARRAAAAPPPVSKLTPGMDVTFDSDGAGTILTGTLTEIDGAKFVVDTHDGGEPWELEESQLTPVAPPAPTPRTAPPAAAAPTARKAPPAPGKAPAAGTAKAPEGPAAVAARSRLQELKKAAAEKP